MEEVYRFLKEAETYYLATVDGDQPRVRPFGTADIYEGKNVFILYGFDSTGKRNEEQDVGIYEATVINKAYDDRYYVKTPDERYLYASFANMYPSSDDAQYELFRRLRGKLIPALKEFFEVCDKRGFCYHECCPLWTGLCKDVKSHCTGNWWKDGKL